MGALRTAEQIVRAVALPPPRNAGFGCTHPRQPTRASDER
jgi:hypothetical protein